MNKITEKKMLSALALSTICVGYTCTINNVTLGAQLGTHMTFSHGILTMLIGYIIISAMTVANCLIGAKERTTGKEIWCHTFGSKGGKIPSIIVALCMVIFAFFDFWYVGDVFKNLFPATPDIGFAIGMAVIVACAIFGACKGTDSLKCITRILIPFAAGLLIVVIACIVNRAGGMDAIVNYQPQHTISIPEGINVFLGGFMICVGLWPDITMDCRKKESVFIGVPVGLLMYTALFLVGQFGAIGMGSYGIAEIAVELGGALFVLTNIFVIFAQASTIPSNTHMIGIELHENIPVSKYIFIIGEPLVAAAASFIIEHLADISILSAWAGVIGVIFAPIAGVTIAEYWIVNHGRFRDTKEMCPDFYFGSVMVAVVGIVTGVYFTYFNPVLPASITSFAVSFFLQAVFGTILVRSNLKKNITCS